MSVHSDHYESYEEEKQAMYFEYVWDRFNEYHDPRIIQLIRERGGRR